METATRKDAADPRPALPREICRASCVASIYIVAMEVVGRFLEGAAVTCMRERDAARRPPNSMEFGQCHTAHLAVVHSKIFNRLPEEVFFLFVFIVSIHRISTGISFTGPPIQPRFVRPPASSFQYDDPRLYRRVAARGGPGRHGSRLFGQARREERRHELRLLPPVSRRWWARHGIPIRQPWSLRRPVRHAGAEEARGRRHLLQ